MPTRWIVFRLINYLVMLSTTLLVIALLIAIEQSQSGGWIINLVFFCSFGIILINSIFNIVWLERYYPAQIPPLRFKRMSIIFFILTIIILVFFLIGLFTILYDILLSEYSSRYIDRRAMLNLLLFIFTSLGGIYLVIYRSLLIRSIKLNQKLQFNNFLESNG